MGRRGTGRGSGRKSVAAAIGLGYLLGSIPFADLAALLGSRGMATRVDLRAAGSGNPGASNAAAVLGRRWGLAVLVADAGKGAAAGAVGRRIGGAGGAYAAATASIAGHILPVWSGGRGGKGVATSAGACLAVFPAYFPIDAAVAGASAVRLRNAETVTQVACGVWITSAVWWWRRGLPNAWGPLPGPGLVAFAVAGSAMILTKFRISRPSR